MIPVVYKIYHLSTSREYYFTFKPDRFNLILLCLDENLDDYNDLVKKKLRLDQVFHVEKIEFNRIIAASP
jgi:hypothetical protein